MLADAKRHRSAAAHIGKTRRTFVASGEVSRPDGLTVELSKRMGDSGCRRNSLIWVVPRCYSASLTTRRIETKVLRFRGAMLILGQPTNTSPIACWKREP